MHEHLELFTAVGLGLGLAMAIARGQQRNKIR
jgi:hypothetical protein